MISKWLFLFTWLLANSAGAAAVEEVGGEFEYKDACGPIAAWSAMRILDGDSSPSLREVAVATAWSREDGCTISGILNALNKSGNLSARAVQMSPQQLWDWVGGDRVAIIFVRRNSETVNHAVCAYHSSGDVLTMYGYPELIHNISRRRLPDFWDGDTIIIEKQSYNSRVLLPWLVLPAATCVWVVTRIAALRRSATIACLLVLAGGCVSEKEKEIAPQISNAPAVPNVKFQMHDFGLIDRTSAYTARFKFRNDASESVAIANSATTCGCVKFVNLPKSIPAQSDVEFDLELGASDRRELVRQSGFLTLENGVEAAFELSGVVRGAWVENPKMIDLGRVVAGERKTASIKVCGAYEPDVVFEAQAPTGGAVECSLAPEAGFLIHGQTSIPWRQINVSVNEKATPGVPLASVVTVVVSNGAGVRDMLKIPVRADVEGQWKVVPRSIGFGTLSRGQIPTRICRVELTQKANISPDDVILTADHHSVDLKLERLGDKRMKLIAAARVNKTFPDGLTRGEIVAKYGQEVLFRIPYVLVVLPDPNQPAVGSLSMSIR